MQNFISLHDLEVDLCEFWKINTKNINKHPENEEDLKNEDSLKDKDNLKMKATLKNKTTSKIKIT